MPPPTSTIRYLGDLRTECVHVRSGSVITTDAPVDNQGKGEAFSPTDLLSNSLVTCMLTTMAIAARREKIPFGPAEAAMHKIMTSNPRRVARIEVSISMPQENYTPDQKHFLEETARNCPVALSLNPGVITAIQFQY